MMTNGSDRRRTARILGLSHQGLINKLKRYGLEGREARGRSGSDDRAPIFAIRGQTQRPDKARV